MNLDSHPLFSSLPADQIAAVQTLAQRQHFPAGNVLFYEGDPPQQVFLLVSGRIAMTWAGRPHAPVQPGQFVDPSASLGELPHSVKATAEQASELLCWSLADLRQIPGFDEAARRHLAALLQQAHTRLADVTFPVHYASDHAGINPGPYLFKDASVVFAFCEADVNTISATLPDELTLLRPPGRKRAPVIVGLSNFPNAHPENNPDANFAYTETAIFTPVRYRTNPGVFIPHIYPSNWEPILVGREVYGFPKQQGFTDFASREVRLTVDGHPYLHLRWEALNASNEAQLVGALMRWLGLERHLATVAFQIGEVMRKIARLPAHRRVDVYNHKRILSVDATPDAPQYSVNHLTHAVIGVLRWFQISKIQNPTLVVADGPLASVDLTLREAYHTQLDMRLSAGRVMHDYLVEHE